MLPFIARRHPRAWILIVPMMPSFLFVGDGPESDHLLVWTHYNGVATCVENRFNGAFTGTADIESGGRTSSPHLISRVFGGASNPQPCPQCIAGALQELRRP